MIVDFALIANFEKAAKATSVERNPVSIDHKEGLVKVLYIDPGESVPMHAHQMSTDIMIVLEGSGLAIVDGVNRRVKSGDIIFNPIGTRHGIKNTGKSRFKWILIQTPRPNPDKKPPIVE
jgi:quercetin dioxygenase-like cupin family protein